MSTSYNNSGDMNSNMTSCFISKEVMLSKLRTCSEKLPIIGEKQRRTAKIFTSYRKSMSLNPFSVRYSLPEVELPK